MDGNIDCVENWILKSLANWMWKLEFLSLWESQLYQCLFSSPSRRPEFCCCGCVYGTQYIKEKILLESVTVFSCVSARFKIRPNDIVPLVLCVVCIPLGPQHRWTPGCAIMDSAHFCGPTAWLQSHVMELQSVQIIIGVLASSPNVFLVL